MKHVIDQRKQGVYLLFDSDEDVPIDPVDPFDERFHYVPEKTKNAKGCWTWAWITEVDRLQGQCKICCKHGLPLPHVKSPCSTNNAFHLEKKHQVTKNCEATARRQEQLRRPLGTPRLDALADAARTKSEIYDMFLHCAFPVSLCEDWAFRKRNPYCDLSRETLRANLIKHATKRLNEALSKLAGRTVTLALDAGSLWEVKYLAICAVAPGFPNLLVELATSDSVTGDFVAECLDRCVEKLKEFRVEPVGYVSDNGANMLCGIERVKTRLLKTRCAAHSLQLALNDYFENDCEVWKRAGIKLLSDNKYTLCPTRWSGRYIALDAILNNRKSLFMIEESDLTELTVLKDAHLRYYYLATQLLQSRNASMLTAASVLHGLLLARNVAGEGKRINTRLLGRASLLLTDPMMIIAYFHPGLRRNSLPAPAQQHEPSIRDEIITIINYYAVGPEGRRLMSDLHSFRSLAVECLPAHQELTTEEYVSFWTAYDGTIPTLVAFLTKVVRMKPTEADCERAFSHLKHCIGRLQTKTKADYVEASVTGKCAVDFLHDLEENAEKPPKVEELDAQEIPSNRIRSKLSGTMASDLLTTWLVCLTKDRVILSEKKARRENHDDCCVCKTKHTSAEGEEDESIEWIQCLCGRWATQRCLDLDDEGFAVRVREGWRCGLCMAVRSIY
jgi:hypothetical protein